MYGSGSLLKNLFFSWVTPFIHQNERSLLTAESLLPLPPETSSRIEGEALASLLAGSSYSRTAVTTALIRRFRKPLTIIVALSAVFLLSSVTSPTLLKMLIQQLQGAPIPSLLSSPVAALEGLGLPAHTAAALLVTLLLFCSSITSIVSIHHLFFWQVTNSFCVKLGICHLIYQKLLRIDRAERQKRSSGSIINLIGVDAAKIQWFTQFLHFCWLHPIMIITILAILHHLVGVPAFFGSATLLIFLAFSALATRQQARLRKRLLKVTDQRIGLTSEVLTHAKTVKLENWEGYAEERIGALRAEEVRFQRKLALLSAIISFCTVSAAPLAMLVTFGTYVYRGGTLDAALVFTTLAYLGALRFALGNLPEAIFNFIDASVSLARICGFLLAKERSPITNDLSQPLGAITLEGVRWMWEEDRAAISLDSLTIKPGELLAVVGGSGGGKTALLLGLLGELTASSGRISLHGSVGYVAQEAWIISDSIRNNIVCGLPFHEERYKQALRTSALEADLREFPGGDLTEVGERGVTLSGGQRQRVALARTFYAQSDIYLFDDPLSALDPNVAHQVFYGMICGDLRNTTRILVTHRLEYALLADRVAVIENGSLLEVAPPAVLRERNPRFRELVEIHEETHLAHPQGEPSSHTELTLEPATLQGDEDAAQLPRLETPEGRTVVEEDRARGAVNFGTLLQYVARLAPRGAATLLLSLFIIRQLLSVAGDLWVAKFSTEKEFAIYLFVGGYACLVLSLAGMNFLRSVFMFWRGVAAGVQSHTLLLGGILRAPLRFFEANPVGRILNRFSRDLETVEISLPRSLLDTLTCMAEVTAVIVLTAVLQPIAAIFILPLAVIYIRLFTAFRPTAREGQRLESITRSPVFATLSESLRGTETLRASNAEGVFRYRFDYFQDQNIRAFVSVSHPNRWLGVRLEVLGALLLLIVSTLSALLPLSPLRAAVSGLTLTYIMTSLGALNWLIRSLSQVENNLTSFERIEAYAHVPAERWEGCEPPPPWPERGEITCNDLSVRYRAELPCAISHLSCTIPSGARVGVIGRTGSGKSTLIATLMRLIEPSEGTITIDGVSTASIPLERLRGSITVIPQEPVLFAGTVRDALDPRHAFSDHEVWRALERVELAEFIKQLPAQLSGKIREGGGNLSVGQRQLLCLARAFLKRNRIIVMDEATANIDVQTDYAIQRTIRRECGDVTMLVVAHRLGTVLDSDLLLVMEQGTLREFGSPQDLLADPNSFLSRVTSQIVEVG